MSYLVHFHRYTRCTVQNIYILFVGRSWKCKKSSRNSRWMQKKAKEMNKKKQKQKTRNKMKRRRRGRPRPSARRKGTKHPEHPNSLKTEAIFFKLPKGTQWIKPHSRRKETWVTQSYSSECKTCNSWWNRCVRGSDDHLLQMEEVVLFGDKNRGEAIPKAIHRAKERVISWPEEEGEVVRVMWIVSWQNELRLNRRIQFFCPQNKSLFIIHFF